MHQVFRSRPLAMILVTAVGVSSGMVQHGLGQSPAAPQLPRPVLDVPGLMNAFNRPLYGRLQTLMRQELAQESQWNQLQYEGLRAAEVANLIVLRQVPAEAVPTVVTHAAEMQEAGLALAQAGHARNAAQAHQAYRRLVQSCNACHQAIAPEAVPRLAP